MGMCKGCSKVFSSLEMKNGYCKECLPESEKEQGSKDRKYFKWTY